MSGDFTNDSWPYEWFVALVWIIVAFVSFLPLATSAKWRKSCAGTCISLGFALALAMAQTTPILRAEAHASGKGGHIQPNFLLYYLSDFFLLAAQGAARLASTLFTSRMFVSQSDGRGVLQKGFHGLPIVWAIAGGVVRAVFHDPMNYWSTTPDDEPGFDVAWVIIMATGFAIDAMICVLWLKKVCILQMSRRKKTVTLIWAMLPILTVVPGAIQAVFLLRRWPFRPLLAVTQSLQGWSLLSRTLQAPRIMKENWGVQVLGNMTLSANVGSRSGALSARGKTRVQEGGEEELLNTEGGITRRVDLPSLTNVRLKR